jgi:hypothetical protein
MKKLIPFIALCLFSYTLAAQPVKLDDIPGTYAVSKFYMDDTLYFDEDNPEKADRNILINVGKQIAIINSSDSTIALQMFYKDLKSALSVSFSFYKDGLVKTYDPNPSGTYDYSYYEEQWTFDEKKQKITILKNGGKKDVYPVKFKKGKVVILIDDKAEKIKLELRKNG